MELGEHDLTLAEIMQDKEKQEFFINRYLYSEKPDDAREIADALADGTMLSQKQTTLLETVREKFNIRMAEVEKVTERFTPEEVTRVAEIDPRIKEILGKIGPEKAAEFLATQFQGLAVSDKRAFNRMVKSMRTVHEVSTGKDAVALDKEITETLSSHRISEADYFKAATSGLTVETKANLDKLVAEQFGWFRKSVDWATGGGLRHRGGRELYMQLEEQQKLVAECDKHRKSIGKVLQGTLTSDVNLAIQKYMMEGGNLEEKKPKNTVETIADYKSIKDDLNSTQSRYDQYLQSEMKRRRINNIAQQPAILDEIKEKFADQEFKKQKRYTAIGALGALLAFLFRGRTKDDIKNSLK